MTRAFLFVFLPAYLFCQDFSSEAMFADSSAKKFAEKLVTLALKNYPQNELYFSRVRIAEENLFQNKWAWLNNLNLTYQYNPSFGGTQNDGTIVPRFGIGISVNVGSIIMTPSRVQQAEEEKKIAVANLETQKVFIRAEIMKRLANYTRALDLLKVRTQAVNDAESNLAMSKERFSKGEIPLEILNQSLRTFTDNQERMVTSTGDLLYHKATLEELIGVSLETVK